MQVERLLDECGFPRMRLCTNSVPIPTTSETDRLKRAQAMAQAEVESLMPISPTPMILGVDTDSNFRTLVNGKLAFFHRHRFG